MHLPPSAFDHDAWLVDLDGTLYAPMPVKGAMAAELLIAGPNVIKIIKQFRKEHEALRTLDHIDAYSPFDEQLQRTAKALEVPVDRVDQVIREWMIQRPCKWLHLFKRRWLFRDIEKFRNKGGLTAVVSDYPAEKKLKAMFAHMLIDEVVANGEPGGPMKLKPAPDGYLEAAKRLGIEPSDCLVLGDRADADGEAARAAGMDFYLIK